jgi:hypothetical protein
VSSEVWMVDIRNPHRVPITIYSDWPHLNGQVLSPNSGLRTNYEIEDGYVLYVSRLYRVKPNEMPRLYVGYRIKD